MASNPMQRKARNSFLLGMIITLLITGAIIVFLFLQLNQQIQARKELEAQKVNVFTLSTDVKSGQVITEDMFTMLSVDKNTIPANATSVIDVIDSWYLQTKDGQMFNTDAEGLYLNESDSLIELTQQDGGYYRNDTQERVTLRTDPLSYDGYLFMVDTNSEDSITRVYQEDNGNYYRFRLESDNTTISKEYIEVNNVPVVAKLDLMKNTVVTADLVVQSDEVITYDVRREEYNMITLPVDLMTDDYVDIRVMFPNGQNFIVVSKALVEVPQNPDETYISDTIWLNLREDEILMMSSAIVEAYGVQGAKIYATKYAEPGMQAAATPNYVPNQDVLAEIQRDPNIVETAMNAIRARITQDAANLRNQYIQSIINSDQGYSGNVQSGMETGITNSDSARRQYIESMQY